MSRVHIIGGGIIGLSTAVELVHNGYEVTVFDPSPISGATSKSGGMIAPTAEVVYQQTPLFSLMHRSAEWYPDLVGLISSKTDLPLGYHAEGTLLIAVDQADSTYLSQLREYQTRHGFSAVHLTVRQARTKEPALSPDIHGAFSLPYDHYLTPYTFARAAYDAGKVAGVDFRYETASHISFDYSSSPAADPSAAHVHTERGVYDADYVIVANGLGARDITGWWPENPLALRPVYGEILTVRVPAPLCPLVSSVIRGYCEGFPIYIIPREDNTLAIGATSREDGRTSPPVFAVNDLLRHAIRMVPGIAECDFLRITTGARPGTPDDLPYLGKINSRLVVSTGYFRHGILLAALAARVTRELIAGIAPSVDISACNPLRHAS